MSQVLRGKPRHALNRTGFRPFKECEKGTCCNIVPAVAVMTSKKKTAFFFHLLR
jgi:hypothetical protein